MRSRLRQSIVALFSVSLFGVALASCAGGSSGLPQAAQQPQTFTNPANSPQLVSNSTVTTITIKNSDRSAVATHGAIKTHADKTIQQMNGGGVSTKSVVHTSNLQYFGGALLKTAKVYNAFVDSTPSAFAAVAQFEQRLSRSNLIHVSDQYVKATSFNRYDWGGDVSVSYPAVTTLGDNDLLLIIHAVAAGVAGGGLGHIYNIFLPKGLNYCSTGTLLPVGACTASLTSPNPSFCAFHGAVVFSDIHDTLFTVQPYTDPSFCSVNGFTQNPAGATPNGLQADSQFSQLSHELFETITDPNPGTGWINPNPFYQPEIGDLCAYVTGSFNSMGFVVPQNTTLYGKVYRIQFEYSNKQIGCANSPP